MTHRDWLGPDDIGEIEGRSVAVPEWVRNRSGQFLGKEPDGPGIVIFQGKGYTLMHRTDVPRLLGHIKLVTKARDDAIDKVARLRGVLYDENPSKKEAKQILDDTKGGPPLLPEYLIVDAEKKIVDLEEDLAKFQKAADGHIMAVCVECQRLWVTPSVSSFLKCRYCRSEKRLQEKIATVETLEGERKMWRERAKSAEQYIEEKLDG